MRNKNLIAALAIIVTLISVYQLYFTLRGDTIDSDIIAPRAEAAMTAAKADTAANYTEAELDSIYKTVLTLAQDSLRDTEMGIFGATYADIKRKELNLGLDLQGGMHITLIVSPEGIIKAMAGSKRQGKELNEVIAATNKAQLTNSAKYTQIFYNQYLENGGEEGKLYTLFYSRSNKNGITRESSDESIVTLIDKELDDAIDRSVIILRSRVDAFGASQPIINTVKATGRIEIELPGVEDKKKVELQVSKVAKLEFLEVAEDQNAQAIIAGVYNEILAIETEKRDRQTAATTDEIVGDTAVDTGLLLENEDEELVDLGDEVDTTGLVEGGSQGPDSLTLNAQNQELSQLMQSYLTLVPFSQTSFKVSTDKAYKTRMKLYLSMERVKRHIPLGYELLWGENDKDKNGVANGRQKLYIVKRGRLGEPLLDGSVVVNARADQDPTSGQLYVSMTMNTEGTREWAQISEEYMNNGKRVAVVLDNYVYSAPVFRSKIANGSSQISGDFGQEEAKDLANVLNAGRLPAPTIIERIVTVGPSLGAEAIQSGIWSLAIGLGLVVLFMVGYYNKGGLIANVALLFNLFFILGILSTPAIGAALTLPGMAGIVLTIGMSIDANVLVFERIREEIKLGKPVKAAIDSGYSKAFWTIFDANVTTLLAAAILYSMGDGLVKGFAVTLMIGIFCSFFSAVYITRLIVELMTMKKDTANISFTTGLSKNLFQNLSINFVDKRRMAYLTSAVVIIAGVVVMVTNGLNLGVAFEGGRSYVVKFDEDVQASVVKSDLKSVFGEDGVETKTFNGDDQLQITTSFMVDATGIDADNEVEAKLLAGLSKYKNPNIVQSITVGPTIADDIIRSSIIAIVLALMAVFAYILIRFRRWQFGLGALAALFHDVLIVLSIFAFARLAGLSFEIDEVFIAAVLTIVGYSINDTVVVFDRVKEGLHRVSDKSGLRDSLNTALNGTLSRTLMTSVTTLIVIIVLLVFGGEALAGFSFALLVGVLVGTYSSVFVATPIVLDTTKDEHLITKTED